METLQLGLDFKFAFLISFAISYSRVVPYTSLSAWPSQSREHR